MSDVGKIRFTGELPSGSLQTLHGTQSPTSNQRVATGSEPCDAVRTALVVLGTFQIAGLWLIYRLFLQRGRLLLQIEALERPFGDSEDRGGNIEQSAHTSVGPTMSLQDVSGLPTHGSGVDVRPREGSRAHSPSIVPSRLVRDGLKKGTPAPPFSLSDLNGRTIALGDYLGKQILLVFSDPECRPCQTLMPELERLHQQSADPVVMMISRGGLEANRAKAAQNHVSFPIVLQRHWEISRAYGMFATPIGYVIDRRGRLASDVAVGVDAILRLVPNDVRLDTRAPAGAAR